MGCRTLLVVCGFLASGAGSYVSWAAKSKAPTPHFFKTEVQPILSKNCFGCHGPEKQAAGLRLDTKSDLLKGARSGPVIVDNDPAKSSLVQVLHYNGDVQMPPSGKLKQSEIDTIIAWVKLGAPWSASNASPRPASQKVAKPTGNRSGATKLNSTQSTPVKPTPSKPTFAVHATSDAVTIATADQDVGDKVEPQAAEFFETKIRPLLVNNCISCHGPNKQRGGLRLDSKARLLEGVESGPIIVGKDPAKSRLIQVVHYTADIKMPPSGKLKSADIEALETWVKMGTPWPGVAKPASAKTVANVFDLKKRKAEHWAWQQIRKMSPPPVKNAAWAKASFDPFILSKLEQKKLKPAPPADRRSLIRRAYFDVTGLPPTPEEVEAFVSDRAPNAFEKVVDHLLRSPHYGERWARHWLDLVRYAETRGHELEPIIPNAWQYRDYLVRAFNVDVPYDQLLTEHLAGDLMPKPRLNPTQGYNESILGTGFWFLGEEVHSPVDIRQDETDRMASRVDTMTKTFQGLTVSCARCHDHKFDAISQKDFYALNGFLLSSSYRQVAFETNEHNAKVAEQLDELQRKAGPELLKQVAQVQRPTVERLADYLMASREVIVTGAEFEPFAHEVLEDFEQENLSGDDWLVEGGSFVARRSSLAVESGQKPASGHQGTRLLSSFAGKEGAKAVGKLTSKPFPITHRYIRFLIGGGKNPDKTCINLRVGDKVVRTATGANEDYLKPGEWEVSEFKGQQAVLEIVDSLDTERGYILVDDIVLSDQTPDGAPSGNLTDASKKRVVEVAAKQSLEAPVLGQWVKALMLAERNSQDPLHAFATVAKNPDNADPVRFAQNLKKVLSTQSPTDQKAPLQVIVDYSRDGAGQWYHDGFAFGQRPVRPGDVVLGDSVEQPVAEVVSYHAARRDAAWNGLKPAGGVEPEAGGLGGWNRAGRTIRTPKVALQSGKLFYLVRGAGRAYAAVDSHLVVLGPLHGRTLIEWELKPNEWKWIQHDLRAYKGHRVEVEFTPKTPKGDAAVAMVVESEQEPVGVRLPQTLRTNPSLTNALSAPGAIDLATLAKAYQQVFTAVAQTMSTGRIAASGDVTSVKGASDNASDMAELADWCVRNADLFSAPDSPQRKQLADAAQPFVQRRAELIKQIKTESQTAPAMFEGNGVDENLLKRGSSRTPADPVPRRFLEALGGAHPGGYGHGSGRLQLAQQMLDRKNPFTARVMVNRVWHHLFGTGIVATVDNFGVLGQKPSHPELLDFLSEDFRNNGWSMKHLIKRVMMSSTYQMSSQVEAKAEEIDPQNVLLHRMPMRRLQAESIRDAILAVSGRLDPAVLGPPVEVHLTPYMDGRGRPGNGGPLDGDGRRSIYTKIRRNFLPPMMLAYDMPIPFATIGRRSISNVPAQALILMNDPFVVQQAKVWAKRVLAPANLTPEKRITNMYLSAFSRPPTSQEIAAATAFLSEAGESHGLSRVEALTNEQVWAELAHVLFNVKEFIFIR